MALNVLQTATIFMLLFWVVIHAYDADDLSTAAKVSTLAGFGLSAAAMIASILILIWAN